jgi:hypothetical protein
VKVASADFADALAQSHTALATADAWLSGVLTRPDLPVVTGDVTLTADSLVRGSLTLSVAGDDLALAPLDASSPLSTYGQEVNVRRGVALTSGVNELVSLGWYRINTAETMIRWQQRANGLSVSGVQVSLDGEDRMASARDYRFTSPYQPSGTVHSAVRYLVQACGLPTASWTAANPNVTGSAVYEEDRLDALAALASSANAQVFVDGNGVVQLTPLPSLDNPQFTYRLGDVSQVLDLRLRTTREGVSNAVVAKSESTADGHPPLLSISQEVSGPSRWGGPFGYVPAFYSSPLLTNQAMVDSAAATRLANLISGRDLEVTISVMPDPRMEPNDVVLLDLPVAQYTGRVREVKIPIGPGGGPQSVRLRLMSNRTVVKFIK